MEENKIQHNSKTTLGTVGGLSCFTVLNFLRSASDHFSILSTFPSPTRSRKFLAVQLSFRDCKCYERRFVALSINSWGRVSDVEIPLTRCIDFSPNAKQCVYLT